MTSPRFVFLLVLVGVNVILIAQCTSYSIYSIISFRDSSRPKLCYGPQNGGLYHSPHTNSYTSTCVRVCVCMCVRMCVWLYSNYNAELNQY